MRDINRLPSVTVTPMDCHMGLDIARTLNSTGIKVFAVDSFYDESAPGTYSKHIEFLESPKYSENDGKDYISFLLEHGKTQPEKSVLFPLSDVHVLLISKYRDVLEDYFYFVLPGHDTLSRLASKDGLYDLANQFGIPTAKTVISKNAHDVERISAQLSYPVILKPTQSANWHTSEIRSILKPGLTSGHAKVVVCDNPDDLVLTYEKISKIDPSLVIQEIIPGEDSRLFYFSFYLDRKSQPLGVFAGNKKRVIPIGFGSASYVHSYYDEYLITNGLKLLQASKYRGLGGIEFKKDPRDEEYKLVEFNTRFGMWDGLGQRCGVDLAQIAYKDAIGIEVEPISTYKEGVIWIDIQRDIRSAIANNQKGNLSIRDWLKSLRGEKMWAVYSKQDWKPGFIFTLLLIKNIFKRWMNLETPP